MPRPKGQTLTEKDIVDAAIALLEREGEPALGVNRVARELGIQPPSLYNHIAGNEALRLAVAVEGYRRTAEFVTQQVADIEEPTLALKTVAHALRSFAKSYPRLYAVTTTNPFKLDHPEFAQYLTSAVEFYTTLLKPFDLCADDIVHTIRILLASIHGFIQAEQVGLFVFSQSVDESYERMINTLDLLHEYLIAS
ncbi:TetR/AcrR family transcriptional regulator [Leptolyngbya sp. FACHB-671]|uniref:TetR/AcrR family transcriptional regulator n=1 Tax=Leptolyngbya sp. FACHB-671 TaxID=2692812 RepID=UPI00168479E6|nr:TetR/AcrR family transcriptional regulator [Leptolyngbya sp. FACHB-671]MBD2071343.1 TetR/AcrR family transcriptional regulator [Leptolyngbya sp. FACHB-671]